MSKCQHLIDISPYDPLCDHPCRLYGGGAVEAECETCQYRIADLEAENAKLREDNDRLIQAIEDLHDVSLEDELVRIENENAKLRELCRRYCEYVSQDRCEGCVCKSRCNDGEVDECWQLTKIRELARELGVEVDG